MNISMKKIKQRLLEKTRNEQPETTCRYCWVNSITAGSYPPFCSPYCEYWYNVEVEFAAWATSEGPNES